MKITNFFINRPVIALIFNAMIALIGYLSFTTLSVREYPDVDFPRVEVKTYYPNASPEVVESAVTNPLEDELAGIEGIDSITSNSKHGASYIWLTFKNGTPIDKSLISIREAIGQTRLPKEAKTPLIQRKGNAGGLPFMIISLEAANMDFGELTHYANLHLKNTFRGIKGIASVEVWGQPYTYNIILDPHKMFSFGINADDVYQALTRANLSLPAGKFQNEISVTLNSELKSVKDYENLVVKEKALASDDSSYPAVLLKQVADVKLETDTKKFRVRINGKPGLSLSIYKASDANPLEVSTAVHQQVEQLGETLPHGIKMHIVADQADFVRHALKNVKTSIIEAIFFVLIIIFLFLRNLHATLIPLITIPISLLGSFVFLKLFGFSINIMTLLAMVLAIGLVVDDAIVVLENIQRHIEKGLSPLDAALAGSKEIGFAIIVMTLTLTSVYAPLAFVNGPIGDLFIEFAVALAGSVLISGVVALTLSPLMCARTLKQTEKPLWPDIDRFLTQSTQRYQTILSHVITHQKACAAIFIISFCAIFLLIKTIPNETTPKEDRGLIGVFMPPIPGKNIDTMDKKISLVEAKVKSLPEAEHSIVFAGEWGANVMLPLKPQNQRSRSAQQIVEAIRPSINQLPSIDAYPWSHDSGLPGIGEANRDGQLALAISSTESYSSLFKAAEKVRQVLDANPLFQNIRHNLKLDTPNYRIDIDTNEMSHLKITAQQIAKTIEVFFSGDQSLNFSKDGILYMLTVKSNHLPWSLNELYVVNPFGKRISLGAIAKIISTSNPDSLYHYNQMRSVILSADLPKNIPLGNAIVPFYKQVSEHLPPAYKKSWIGRVKIFNESKNTMTMLFLLAIVFIYAILAIQFENFIDPFIILLTVPLACLGALFFVKFSGGTLNIYTQIGLITLIGLITKHGILIVEFTNQLKSTTPLKEAVMKASALRLRPILMTTGAMIFGTIPLILSNDAGHEAQRAIGIVLLGGLLLGTSFTLFVLPTVCYAIKRFSDHIMRRELYTDPSITLAGTEENIEKCQYK